MPEEKESAVRLSRLKFEAELLAQQLNESPTSFHCIDFGADFGRFLAKGLAKLGWAESIITPVSKMAQFETQLAKEEVCHAIRITSSTLRGPFTLVECAHVRPG